jgi:Flp pilus assembly pilin Flp
VKIHRLLFWNDQRGAVFTEYVVIVGLIALATIPAILLCAGGMARNFFNNRWYALIPFP